MKQTYHVARASAKFHVLCFSAQLNWCQSCQLHRKLLLRLSKISISASIQSDQSRQSRRRVPNEEAHFMRTT